MRTRAMLIAYASILRVLLRIHHNAANTHTQYAFTFTADTHTNKIGDKISHQTQYAYHRNIKKQACGWRSVARVAAIADDAMRTLALMLGLQYGVEWLQPGTNIVAGPGTARLWELIISIQIHLRTTCECVFEFFALLFSFFLWEIVKPAKKRSGDKINDKR